MIKKQIVKAMAVGFLALAAGQASAYSLSLGGGAGTVQFNEIDWASNGSAWVNGFQGGVGPTLGVGSSFDLFYISKAQAVNNNATNTVGVFGNTLITSNGTTTGELTIFAKVTEIITNIGVDPITGKSFATFAVISGAWNVYFDAAANASLTLGTGFSDGIKILGGSFTPGVSGSFTNLNGTPGGAGADGSGSNNLVGTVGFTNAAYVNPDPVNTNATTTLQYGVSAAPWTRPVAFNGEAGYGPTDNPSSFVLKADSNQAFLVPEPTSTALIGLGLLGLGFMRRRKA